MLTGGCFCGTIRYEAHGVPFHATLCHCSDCRRAAGAPVVAWFSVATGDYRVVRGRPTVFASSPGAERSFCPACGTSLTFQSMASRNEIDVTLSSLDRPDDLPPADNTGTASRLRWWSLVEGLPDYPTTRPDGT